MEEAIKILDMTVLLGMEIGLETITETYFVRSSFVPTYVRQNGKSILFGNKNGIKISVSDPKVLVDENKDIFLIDENFSIHIKSGLFKLKRDYEKRICDGKLH